MDPILALSIETIQRNSKLYEAALDGLGTEDLSRAPGNDSNPMIWVAGHLLFYRATLLKLLGENVEPRWGDVFQRGAKGGPNTRFPELGEVRQEWTAVTDKLVARLRSLTDEEASAPSPAKFPVEEDSMRATVGFLTWHEGYHIGQMAYLRKWLGRPGLVG